MGAAGAEDAKGDASGTTASAGTVASTMSSGDLDAMRLLNQAAFGPSPSAIERVKSMGVRNWLVDQFAKQPSYYRYATAEFRHADRIDTSRVKGDYCANQSEMSRDDCWRTLQSTVEIEKDFYQQAIHGDDQLRQRVAFALSQILVISNNEINSAYAIAEYQQMLRNLAFGNYRDILAAVAKSPAMGHYLNMVNNSPTDPNENFARELLQLFSLGACVLDEDGRHPADSCEPTYTNDVVREYAFALTGWTYPTGGADGWCDQACYDRRKANPTYMRGQMEPIASRRDQKARTLLGGIGVAAGSSSEAALAAVLDSVMGHPNLAPFVARQMIQFLVTSNPQPGYVARAAAAFRAGTYTDAAGSIGSGKPGDMKALLAAILLDREARSAAAAENPDYGRLREPAQYVINVLRALDGTTSTFTVAGSWGSVSHMGQWVFNPPSVFNFYSPDRQLPGTDLVAPQLAIEGVGQTIARTQFLNEVFLWSGGEFEFQYPAGQMGHRVNVDEFVEMLQTPADAMRVVERLDRVVTGGRLTMAEKEAVVAAMNRFKPADDRWLAKLERPSSWQKEMVREAAWLMFSSASFQVQR